MDLDIDDILADLDRDTTAVPTSESGHWASEGATEIASSVGGPINKAISYNVPSAAQDFEALIRYWRNERFAPELLPYPRKLMSRILSRMQSQIDSIEILSMGFLEETNDGIQEITNRFSRFEKKLPLLCMEAELERVKFVIRSFIRCRLSKIDKFHLFYQNQQEIDPQATPLEELLSHEELEYTERHFHLLLSLLNQSILKHLPTELQAINDTEGSINMITEPDWDKFVFVYVIGLQSNDKREQDHMLTKNEFGKDCYQVVIPELDETLELSIGSIYVARYSSIKDLLVMGRVILI